MGVKVTVHEDSKASKRHGMDYDGVQLLRRDVNHDYGGINDPSPGFKPCRWHISAACMRPLHHTSQTPTDQRAATVKPWDRVSRGVRDTSRVYQHLTPRLNRHVPSHRCNSQTSQTSRLPTQASQLSRLETDTSTWYRISLVRITGDHS